MKAIYAFSGDPITYGHIDIIERAYKFFPELVVGIGVNPDKKYDFPLEERLEMAKMSLAHLKGVEVVSFTGLLVDYAYENNIGVIIRGIRNNQDMDYEYNIHFAGESQRLSIETISMFAKPELSHVSSSIVKAVVKEQGNAESLVPLCVKRSLEEKMLGQYLLCVTGSIGTGKSYVSDALCKICEKEGIPAHNIDLDIVNNEILTTLTEPVYVELRNKISERFGKEIKNPDGSIDKKKLAEKVFKKEEDLEDLNNMLHPAINERMRRIMYGKKGLILINAALIAEADFLGVSNNNVILLDTAEEDQKERLRERGYDEEKINVRIKSQGSFNDKLKIIEGKINKDSYGRVFTLDTSSKDENELADLFSKILEYMKLGR